MDFATIVGILFGGGLVFFAIATGAGGMKVFYNLPSLGITIGGMIAATLIHFSLSQFLSIVPVIKKTIIQKMIQPSELIQNMVNYAAINRRDGALALEQEINKIDSQFFVQGLQMIVDGSETGVIRDILSLEIDNLQNRHATGKAI